MKIIGCLLGYCAVESGRNCPTFQRCMFTLMLEAVSTSETSISFYQTPRLNTPEDSNLYYCRCS
jgi:hypothetical protein